MRINKRVKNIRNLLIGLKSHKRAFAAGAAVIAGGLCIAYGFSRVEESVMTYVPVTNPEKPVIVLDAGHGGYVLNQVAGAIWFLTLKSSERRVYVVQSFLNYAKKFESYALLVDAYRIINRIYATKATLQ